VLVDRPNKAYIQLLDKALIKLPMALEIKEAIKDLKSLSDMNRMVQKEDPERMYASDEAHRRKDQ